MDAYEYDMWDLQAADTDECDNTPADPAVAASIVAVAVLVLAAALFLASPLPARLHRAVPQHRTPFAVPAGRAIWG